MEDFNDPMAVSMTNGSLQEELAWGMQEAVDALRNKVGLSIEQIML
jgi:hypothetical protein